MAIIMSCVLSACGGQEASNQTAVDRPTVEQEAAPAGPASASSLVPDYPGSSRIEVPNLGVPGTDSRSGNSTMRETDAAPDKVASYYREHFHKAGIPIRADTATASGGLISVARDGERGAMLTISKVGAKTRIGVIVAGGPR
jgi:hypothetical protein